MGDDYDGVVHNIRALIISTKCPIPLRNLSRDYETLIGGPIPYRTFQFQTLESFIQSIPSLRLIDNGRDLLVAAHASEASSHISELVAKQKAPKKSAPPPRRGRHAHFYRGGSQRTNYPPRQIQQESSPSCRYSNSPATLRQSCPRKELSSSSSSSNASNNLGYKEQLTVRVKNDNRQVLVGDSNISSNSSYPSSKEEKPGFEVPPRFQKNRHSSTTSSRTMQMSSVNGNTQDLDEIMYVPSDSDPTLQEIDTNIISALKPSQLIAVGRAKEQDAQLNDLYCQGAMQNSNQVQDIPLPIPDVPSPDVVSIYNNISILLKYALAMNWAVPEYSVYSRKTVSPQGVQTLYGSRVQINKNGQDIKKYSSYPNENGSAIVAKGYAAKRALEELRKEEKVKRPQTIISTDKNIINDRISKIVAGMYNGRFAKTVEEEYIEIYKEQLPSDWLETLRDSPTLSVDKTINGHVIVPKDPALSLDLNDPIITSVPLVVEPPKEEIWDIFVTSALSTNQVWFRLIGENYSEKYEELLNDMEEFYKNSGLNHLDPTIKEGQYYAAQSNDGLFRVCVTNVNVDTKTVNAYLIDHGDNDIFSFKNLYQLPIKFCTLPRQAMQCCLEGLESYGEDPLCCEMISSCELLIGKILIAEVKSRDGKTGFKVTLFDTSGADDVNINEKISEYFLSDFANSVPVMPEEGLAGRVTVSHISKIGEVFIQIQSDRFNQMVALIESLGPDVLNKNKLTSYRQVKLNKIYLAQYSKDQNWYRAVVTATPSVQQNKIALFFVDYGNSQTVSITDLVEVENLHPIISKLPPQAVKVALNNLPLQALSTSQIAMMYSLLVGDEKVILIKVVTMQEDMPIVEMYSKDNSASETIVSVNLTVAMDTKTDRSDNNKSKDKSLSSQQSNGNGMSFISLNRPKFDENNFHQVRVLLAANPGNFFFQLEKYHKELDNLMIQLLSFYETMDLPELKKEDIISGGLYVGLHSDNQWYRLVVTEAIIGSHVAVQFCDFGDIECIPLSKLRTIEKDFCKLPFMAIRGKLSDIIPIHTDWSVEDCVRFQELVFNKSLQSLVTNVDESYENPMDMVVSLNLIDTTLENDVIIADILCSESRAVRVITP